MKIIVNAHKCEINKTPVNEKEINITKCEFEFAEEITSEFVKEAYFTLNHGETYKQIIVDNECNIPGEVLEKQGTVEIGVVAKLVEGTTEIKRYNPSSAYFPTWQGSLKDAENSKPITPSEFDQYEQALQDGLNEVNQKLVDIDEAIEDVNEAITETNNLDLDVNKQGKVATVTLTKKDASTKVVTLSDGTSLMFNWDGTRLGIKTDEDAEYTYVDLQGIQGEQGPMGAPFTIKKTYSNIAEMNADFNNMNVGDYVMITSTVEVEDNAKLYSRGEEQWIFITDFSGATGIQGPTGLTPNIQIGTITSGDTPSVTRTGTNENPVLNFTLVRGETGATGSQGIQGETGNGIASITKTSSEGLVDTYTITYTNGTTSTFQITNGEDGETPLSEFNALKERVEDLENNQLFNEVEGTNINITDAHNTRVYNLELDKESSQETTTGKNLFDKNNTNILNAQINRNTLKLVEDGNARTLWIEIQPNTTYTVSKIASARFRVATLSTQPQIDASITKYESDDSGTTLTITSEANDYYLAVMYYNSTVDTLTEQEILNSIQIEQGTQGTDWEEYTGGQPSPSPEFPQSVKTVKGYRNLLNINDTALTKSARYFVEGDEITSHSTLSSTNGATMFTIPVEVGKKVTISYESVVFSASEVNLRYKEYDEAPESIESVSQGIAISLDDKCAIITTTKPYLTVLIRTSNGGTTIVNGLMVTYTDKKVAYVPYGNNYVDVKVQEKNLLDKSKSEVGSWNSDGSSSTNNRNRRGFEYIAVLPNTTYTLSTNTTMSALRINEYDINQENIQRTQESSNSKLTITTSVDTYYLRWSANYNNTDVFTQEILDSINMQLEQGTSATSYEPYQEINVPIPLNGNEIVGIGNYLDELIVDSDGKVWLNKELYKKIFDGTENITYTSNSSYPFRYSLSNSDYLTPNNNTIPNVLCNYFKPFEWNASQKPDVGITANNNEKKIAFRNINISSLADFKLLLSNAYNNNNPVVLYYPLATPEPIDLQTTVDLRLFKGVNNITNSEDANMEIRYVESIESIINDFDTRLKALEQGESL